MFQKNGMYQKTCFWNVPKTSILEDPGGQMANDVTQAVTQAGSG